MRLQEADFEEGGDARVVALAAGIVATRRGERKSKALQQRKVARD